MDITLLIILAATILIILVCFTFLFKKSSEEKKENRPRPVPNRVREGAPRRAQLARNRGARLRANIAHQEVPPSDNENEQAEVEELDVELIDGKMGAKKKAKLEAKAEKKAQREAEEKVRAEKKKQEKIAEEERKKTEDKEKEEEKLKEDEERKVKDEKERKEYEEYLKMKEAFSVEEEGYEEGDNGNETNLLQEFVSYIKKNKIVVIEDLAAQFKLKTQSAIDRIKDLQKDDILTGVIDDRGKFIYISEDEMNAVAKFIRQRGRVSIAELAENSNTLIHLTPGNVQT